MRISPLLFLLCIGGAISAADPFVGPVTIGIDPGGSEILRAGGGARFAGGSIPGAANAADVLIGSGRVVAGAGIAGATLSASSLTTTRIPFIGPAGLLVDNSGLTYDGTTLSAVQASFGSSSEAASTYTLNARRSFAIPMNLGAYRAISAPLTDASTATGTWYNQGIVSELNVTGSGTNNGYDKALVGVALNRGNGVRGLVAAGSFTAGTFNSGSDTTGSITTLRVIEASALKTPSSNIANGTLLYLGANAGTAKYAIDAIDTAGIVRIGDTTDATTTTNGSVQLRGGLSVAKNIVATGATLGSLTGSPNSALTVSAGSSGSGTAKLRMGTVTREWEAVVGASPYTLSFNYVGTNAPVPNVLTMAANGTVGVSGVMKVSNTSTSTSSTTGALTVAGGVGVAGALNLGYVTSETSITKNAMNIERSTKCVGNVTSYDKGIYSRILSYKIPSGIADAGYKIGLDASSYAADAEFLGTLRSNMGIWARGGIYTSGATARVTNAYGVYSELLTRAGTIDYGYGVYISTDANSGGTVTNRYDLYASTPNAKNYFAGNVGIGATNPTHKLEVSGDAAVFGILTAKEIKVTSTGADYVFEDGYQLMPLSEVKKFIDREKHLPDMMSAKEMQEGGLPVSEVVTKQLAKIEELTLHAIELKQENEKLKSEQAALTAQMAAIMERLERIEKTK
jgi:hypothetical protein